MISPCTVLMKNHHLSRSLVVMRRGQQQQQQLQLLRGCITGIVNPMTKNYGFRRQGFGNTSLLHLSTWTKNQRKQSTVVAIEEIKDSSSSSSSNEIPKSPSLWSSSKTKENRKVIVNKEEEVVDISATYLRRQTMKERITNFPNGIKKLLYNAWRYLSIHDASRTPLNAWTLEHPTKTTTSSTSSDSTTTTMTASTPTTVPPTGNGRIRRFITYRFGFFFDELELRPGRIPRRQYEQQRQTIEDFRFILPFVIIWIPPIIGFIPPIAFSFFPRQACTRQFLNNYEWEIFSQEAYKQRSKLTYLELGDLFWTTVLSPVPITLKSLLLQQQHEGAADGAKHESGPFSIDPMILYTPFADHSSNDYKPPKQSKKSAALPKGLFASVLDIPHEYMVKLALSIGIYQSLPRWMSPYLADWTPTSWLAYEIDRIGKNVVHDDTLLLEEGYHLSNCNQLTETEVLDACLSRGLPVTSKDSVEQRRQNLTNHLNIIKYVKECVTNQHYYESNIERGEEHDSGDHQRHRDDSLLNKSEGFRLFTLHLNPLLYHLKVKHQIG